MSDSLPNSEGRDVGLELVNAQLRAAAALRLSGDLVDDKDVDLGDDRGVFTPQLFLREWLTAEEMALIGPFGRTKLFNLAKRGQIKVVRVVDKGNAHGKTLFSRSSVKEYIRRHIGVGLSDVLDKIGGQ